MSMEAHMKKYYASMFDDARSGSPRRSPRNPPKFKGFRKKKKANGLVESGQSSVRHKKNQEEHREDSIKQLQEFGTIDSRTKKFNEYDQPLPNAYSFKPNPRGRIQLTPNEPHSQSLRNFHPSPPKTLNPDHSSSQKVLSLRNHYGHRFERSPKPVQSTRSYKTPKPAKKMKNSSSTKAVKGVSVGKNKNPKKRGKSGLKNKKFLRGGSKKKLNNSGTGGSLKGSYASIEMQRQVAKKKLDNEESTSKRWAKPRIRDKSKKKLKKDLPKMNFSKKNKEELIDVNSKSNFKESEIILENNPILSLSDLKPRLKLTDPKKKPFGEENKILDYFTRENKEFLNELNTKFEDKYEQQFKDFLFKFEKPVHLETAQKPIKTRQNDKNQKYDYENVFLGESMDLVGRDFIGSASVGDRLWDQTEKTGLGVNFLGESVSNSCPQSQDVKNSTVERIKEEFEQKKIDMVNILMSREPNHIERQSNAIENSENMDNLSRATVSERNEEFEEFEENKESQVSSKNQSVEDIFDHSESLENSQQEIENNLENPKNSEDLDNSENEIEITTETDIGHKRNMINSNHFETDSQTYKNTQTEFSMTETEKIKPIPEESPSPQPIIETENDFEGFQSDYKEDKISLESVDLEEKGSMTDLSKNKVYSITQKSDQLTNPNSPQRLDMKPSENSIRKEKIDSKENISDQKIPMTRDISFKYPEISKNDLHSNTQNTQNSTLKNENLSLRTGKSTRRESEMAPSKKQISVNTQDLQYSDGIEDSEEEPEFNPNIDSKSAFKKNPYDEKNNDFRERSHSVDASKQKPLKRMSNTMEIQKINQNVAKNSIPETDKKLEEEEESDLYDFDDMENDDKYDTREMKKQLMEYELEMNMLALEISRGGSSFEGSDLASNDDNIEKDQEAFPGVKPIPSKQNIFFQVSKNNSHRNSLDLSKKRQILESEIIETQTKEDLITKPGNRLTFASGEVYKLGIKERNESSETEEDPNQGKVIEELDEVAGIRIMIRDKPKNSDQQDYEEVDDANLKNQNHLPRVNDPTQNPNSKDNGNQNFEFRRHTFAVPDGDAVQELIADLQSFGGSGLKQVDNSAAEDSDQTDTPVKMLNNPDNPKVENTSSQSHTKSSDQNQTPISDGEPMEAIGEESESEIDINTLKEKIKTKNPDSQTNSRRYSRYSKNSQEPEIRDQHRKTSHRVTESEVLNQNSFGDIKDLVNTLSQNMDLTQEALIEESFQMFTDKDQKVNAKQFDNTGQLGFIDAIEVLDAAQDNPESSNNTSPAKEDDLNDKIIKFRKKLDKNEASPDQKTARPESKRNSSTNRKRTSRTSDSRDRRNSSGVNVSNLRNETEDEILIMPYKNKDTRLKVDRNEFDSVHYKKWKGKHSDTEESLTEKDWRKKLKGKGVFMSQKDETWKACLNSKIEEKEESDETISDYESDIGSSDLASPDGPNKTKNQNKQNFENNTQKNPGSKAESSNNQISLEEMLKRGNEIRNRVMRQSQNETENPKRFSAHQKKQVTASQEALLEQEKLITERLKTKTEDSVKDEAIRLRLEEVRQINRDSKPFLELACQPVPSQPIRKHSELKVSEIFENDLSSSKLKDEYPSLRDSDYDLSKSRITPERRDSDLQDRKGSYEPLYRQDMLRNLSNSHEQPNESHFRHKNLFKDETSGVEDSEANSKGHPINFETHGKGITGYQNNIYTEHGVDLGDELTEYVSEDESKVIDKLDIFASNMDNDPPSKQNNDLEHSEVIHESQLKRELDQKYGTNQQKSAPNQNNDHDQNEPEKFENSELKPKIENKSSLENKKSNHTEDFEKPDPKPENANTQDFESRYNEVLKKTFLRKIKIIQRAWRLAIQNKTEHQFEKRDSQGPMDINDIFDRFLQIKQNVAANGHLSPQERLNLVENEYFLFLRRLELQNRDKKLLKQLLNSLFFLSKKLEIYPDQELAY